MEQRRLGTTGPELSVVGLGCNNLGMKLDEAQSAAVVHAALDAGITHFDTAEMYGGGASEEFLGKALGRARDEVVVASKYVPRPAGEPATPGAMAKRIVASCEGSLRRLGTDRIDLYYQHYVDPDVAIDEVLEALATLVQAGKVVHTACSNDDAEQLDEAVSVGARFPTAAFSGIQLEWNLVSRSVEDEVVPVARQAGLGIVPYFPLASGLLTGKYRPGEPPPPGSRFESMPFFASVATDDNHRLVEALTDFADARGHTVAELAIAWLAAQDGVASVIAGATTPEQVAANAAGGSWQLSASDLAEVPSNR
jgi:aryl-alcohol dehydrogenase-like predicted oxidoreductase